MTPTPSAQVIEAMARGMATHECTPLHGRKDLTTAIDFGTAFLKGHAEAALRAASEAGWVLVPRAEVEEAADRCWAEWKQLQDDPLRWHACMDFKDLANRLRERSRG